MTIANYSLDGATRQHSNVGMGEMIITADPHIDLVCLGLGSCIAICVYAPRLRLGAMLHVMLPSAKGHQGIPPSKYADTAVPLLATELRNHGVFNIEARVVLVGGASIFPSQQSVLDVGNRNISAVRELLQQRRFKIINEEVGGRESRTVMMNVATGEVRVRTVRTGEFILAQLGEKHVRK